MDPEHQHVWATAHFNYATSLYERMCRICEECQYREIAGPWPVEETPDRVSNHGSMVAYDRRTETIYFEDGSIANAVDMLKANPSADRVAFWAQIDKLGPASNEVKAKSEKQASKLEKLADISKALGGKVYPPIASTPLPSSLPSRGPVVMSGSIKREQVGIAVSETTPITTDQAIKAVLDAISHDKNPRRAASKFLTKITAEITGYIDQLNESEEDG